MEKLNRIEMRLKSLGELGELVGALRSMAATRSREAQDAFVGTTAYCGIVERAIASVASQKDGGAGGTDAAGQSARVLVVITSEHGFVGLFNARLVDHALGLRTAGEALVIVGRRGQIVAQERGVTDVIGFPMTARISGVTTLARRIAARLSAVSAARIVFARHMPGAAFEPSVIDVLPLAAAQSCESAPEPPVMHLPPARLMKQLETEYLFAEIARTLMETLACENGARLRAMDSASRNIEDKIAGLRRDEHVARQEATTTELLDVVTGAEAAAET